MKHAQKTGLADAPTFIKMLPPLRNCELLSDEELLTVSHTFAFDVEAYPNYFMVGLKCLATGKYLFFEQSEFSNLHISKLSYILHRYTMVGFNSIEYDEIMLQFALQGASPEYIKERSNEVIDGGNAWQMREAYSLTPLRMNHIDLIEVAPLSAPLKLYGGRIHAPRLQDLPFPHNKIIDRQEIDYVRGYNGNDLDLTHLLFDFLKPQIKLREDLSNKYQIDLRSKSDAQIAEAVISKEMRKLGEKVSKPQIKIGHVFQYQKPTWLKFKTPYLNKILNTVLEAMFVVNEHKRVVTPQSISELSIEIGNCIYKMGNGGLHSSEKSIRHLETDEIRLIDCDVESYYPRIVLNEKLVPEHLSAVILDVFENIVTTRLAAKASGDKDTADSLKIVINSLFGKLGDPYSVFYAPQLVTQTTVTGQLALLMQIEMLELAGFEVISANTDGVITKVPRNRYEEFCSIVKYWEKSTGFKTEETNYKAVYSRDVNNYIAIKTNGEVKTKGVYSEVGSALNSPLSKNPESYICSMAVQEFLTKGVPIQETVLNCGQNVAQKHYPTKISRFVSVRVVKGGAQKSGIYLGKSIRWYYGKGETGCINYVTSGNTVAKSEGAIPMMDMLEDLPADLDFEYYIKTSKEMLFDLGYYKRPHTPSLF